MGSFSTAKFELITSSGFPHCHKISKDALQVVVKNAIKENINKKCPSDIDRIYTQTIEEETMYQMGYSGSVRLIGYKAGNVFRILLVDYFHDLYPDEKFNTRTKVTHKYSI